MIYQHKICSYFALPNLRQRDPYNYLKPNLGKATIFYLYQNVIGYKDHT